MSFFNYNYPCPVQFGAGAVQNIPAFLREMGSKNPLIVTDAGVRSQGFFGSFNSLLQKNDFHTTVFDQVQPNPVEGDVLAGVKAFKNSNCDFIVAIGGGAPLDVAKAIALMVHNKGSLWDYRDDIDGWKNVTEPVIKIVAIPTTAGTGSEVGRSAVISREDNHKKEIIFSPKLMATKVFVDPELTVGLPAKITAATGFDALSHNLEAFLAKGNHPLADGIALRGLRLIAENLVKAVKEPNNLEARGNMLMASLMGATAFQKGLGVTHSMAHSLGQVMGMHHGLANAICLPYAMAFNAEVMADRFADVAQAFKLKENTAAAVLTYLRELRAQVGIPDRLSEAGVLPTQLNELVRQAVEDTCHQSNARACTKADFEKLFKQAI